MVGYVLGTFTFLFLHQEATTMREWPLVCCCKRRVEIYLRAGVSGLYHPPPPPPPPPPPEKPPPVEPPLDDEKSLEPTEVELDRLLILETNIAALKAPWPAYQSG